MEATYCVCAYCYEQIEFVGEVRNCSNCRVIEGDRLNLTESELSQALGED